MRRRTLQQTHPTGRINVTPMIDVVMCLIVFYLIVGKLVAEQRSDVYLPPSQTGQTAKTQDLLIINVLSRGRAPDRPAPIEIEGDPVVPSLLADVIRERLAEKPRAVIQIRADRDLPYADVMPVVQACRDAGVRTIRVSAEQTP